MLAPARWVILVAATASAPLPLAVGVLAILIFPLTAMAALTSTIAIVAGWAWFNPKRATRWMIYMNWVKDPRLTRLLKQCRWFFHAHPARNITITTKDGVDLAGWHVLPAGADSRKSAAAASENFETDGDLTTGLAFDAACDESLAEAARVIIFFHGVSGTRGGVGLPHAAPSARVVLARALATHFGAHVVTVDYRGFGGCGGSPSEEGLAADARAAWDWVAERVDGSRCQVFVYGQSMGAAVAVGLAEALLISGSGGGGGSSSSFSSASSFDARPAGASPAGVILDAPFTTLADAAVRHPLARWPLALAKLAGGSAGRARLLGRIRAALPDRWDSASKVGTLAAAGVPLLVVGHASDEVVPCTLARALFCRALFDAAKTGLGPEVLSAMEDDDDDGGGNADDNDGAAAAIATSQGIDFVGTARALLQAEYAGARSAMAHVAEALGTVEDLVSPLASLEEALGRMNAGNVASAAVVVRRRGMSAVGLAEVGNLSSLAPRMVLPRLLVLSRPRVLKRHHVDACTTPEWLSALGAFLDESAAKEPFSAPEELPEFDAAAAMDLMLSDRLADPGATGNHRARRISPSLGSGLGLALEEEEEEKEEEEKEEEDGGRECDEPPLAPPAESPTVTETALSRLQAVLASMSPEMQKRNGRASVVDRRSVGEGAEAAASPARASTIGNLSEARCMEAATPDTGSQKSESGVSATAGGLIPGDATIRTAGIVGAQIDVGRPQDASTMPSEPNDNGAASSQDLEQAATGRTYRASDDADNEEEEEEEEEMDTAAALDFINGIRLSVIGRPLPRDSKAGSDVDEIPGDGLLLNSDDVRLSLGVFPGAGESKNDGGSGSDDEDFNDALLRTSVHASLGMSPGGSVFDSSGDSEEDPETMDAQAPAGGVAGGKADDGTFGEGKRA